GIMWVWLAAGLLASVCLRMSVRFAADIYIVPGRWDRQLADALQCCDVADMRTVGDAVVEAVARLAARDAGHRVVDVTQLRAPCRDGGIERRDRRRNNVDISLFYVIGFLS